VEPLVTVIVPTKNSEDLIGNCLKSLQELDYPRDRLEIIISDGLSSDTTREIAESYGAKVMMDYGKSIVSGRNAAFAIAQGKLIAITDADCTFDKDWLKNSPKYFKDDRVGGIGGPNLVPPNETNFGKAVGLIFEYAPYVTKAAHTKVHNRVIESRSHGSNAIYRADVLRQVTPVDESLIGGEDVIMNEEIQDLGYKLLYVPDVAVFHSRRPTPKKWWHQIYKYGKDRVLLSRKRKGNLHLAHIAVGLSVPILVIICGMLAIMAPRFLVAMAGALFLMLGLSSVFALARTKSFGVALNMPVVLAISVLAWSLGFLREYVFAGKPRQRESLR